MAVLASPGVPNLTADSTPFSSMAESSIAAYDNRSASLYDWVANESLPHRFVMGYTMKQTLGSLKGQTLLEMACGNGAYMEYCITECGAKQCFGVDLSKENLEICAKHHQAAGIPPEQLGYAQADLTAPNQVFGRFDHVLMGCCVCYSTCQEELTQWLRNVRQNLVPGGRAVIVNTRGAVRQPEQRELKEKFGIDYLEEAEGYTSFSPAFVRFPNGWESGAYSFIKPETICETLVDVGFELVERKPMLADPGYDGEADIERLKELSPYDLIVAYAPQN